MKTSSYSLHPIFLSDLGNKGGQIISHVGRVEEVSKQTLPYRLSKRNYLSVPRGAGRKERQKWGKEVRLTCLYFPLLGWTPRPEETWWKFLGKYRRNLRTSGVETSSTVPQAQPRGAHAPFGRTTLKAIVNMVWEVAQQWGRKVAR